MNKRPTPSQLQRYTVPVEALPPAIRERVESYTTDGTVSAGYTESVGWFILVVNGRVPQLAWSERIE